MTTANHPAKKLKVASISMVASVVVAALKFTAAFATGSLGLLSEAFHSLADMSATVITYFAVRLSDRPADDNHHFGHAKIESLAALVEIGLLFAIAVWFTYEGISRLIGGETHVEVTWWAIAILVISILVDLNRSRALQKVASDTSSAALKADAAHFETDMYGSFAVLIGLAGVWFGFPWADIVATFAVAGLMTYIAWKLLRETLATLIDAAPEGVSEKLRPAFMAVPSVLEVQSLRIRPAGGIHFVTIEIDIPRTLPVTDVTTLKQHLTKLVKDELPNADVVISANPVELDNETIFQKATLLAAQQGHAIHHMTVQNLEGKMAFSFDCEFDGTTTLQSAHAQATELESSIRDSLGSAVEVECHIEPLPFRPLIGQEAPIIERERVLKELQEASRPEHAMSDIHSVRVRDTEDGFFVHYHCRFAGTSSVQDVHDAVDRVEIRLVQKLPLVKRVIAHAEPVGQSPHAL
jgi:cation diffusion facilitator family transporter